MPPSLRGPLAPLRWPAVAANDLHGFTVAVTADRRRDEQTVLLERLGAQVLMFPLLRTELGLRKTFRPQREDHDPAHGGI